MNHTIYIAAAVKEDFERETNKSGLVNDLLLRHYGKAPSSEQKHYPKRLGQDATLVPLASENLERACCLGKIPCKHWSFVADRQVYVNSLSGREKIDG